MTALRRLPFRVRLTAAFAGVMTVLLAVLGLSIDAKVRSALLDEIDAGLRFRAAALTANLGLDLTTEAPGLIEGNESVAQVETVDGRVLTSSPGLGAPLLGPADLARVRGATFFERRVPGVIGGARLLAIPESRSIVVVGTSMADRADALGQLRLALALGGPIAVLLASAAGWLMAGLALHPVERMRRQAAAISRSELDRRLAVPEAADELRRLAETLNAMLGRLEDAARAERRFLDRASHELRTPLTALKAELDLARSRPRTAEELLAAVVSASEETDRLARLADDLLVLARAAEGQLGLRREATSLSQLISGSARLFDARARAKGVGLETMAPSVEISVDPMRVRQAVDNLVDNALRLTPPGGRVLVTAESIDGAVRIAVSDDGPGFVVGPAENTLDPFGQPGAEGSGLGLAIVRAVAETHGGRVRIENRPGGGARVTLTLPTCEPPR